jgi:hypothetical protein
MKNRSIGYLCDRTTLKKERGDEASSLGELSLHQVREQQIPMILLSTNSRIQFKRWGQTEDVGPDDLELPGSNEVNRFGDWNSPVTTSSSMNIQETSVDPSLQR